MTLNAVNGVTRVPDRGIPFTVDAVFADASGCETLLAAPGASTYLYIKKLVVTTDANITVTIGDGEDTSAVETIRFGPIPFGTAGGSVTIPIARPVRLTANKAFTVDASGAGNIHIYAEGETAG